tara:strand:- start:606 stop:956 length:351 start_codon:yes stop_codon:yes gene_type:complete
MFAFSFFSGDVEKKDIKKTPEIQKREDVEVQIAGISVHVNNWDEFPILKKTKLINVKGRYHMITWIGEIEITSPPIDARNSKEAMFMVARIRTTDPDFLGGFKNERVKEPSPSIQD